MNSTFFFLKILSTTSASSFYTLPNFNSKNRLTILNTHISRSFANIIFSASSYQNTILSNSYFTNILRSSIYFNSESQNCFLFNTPNYIPKSQNNQEWPIIFHGKLWKHHNN